MIPTMAEISGLISLQRSQKSVFEDSEKSSNTHYHREVLFGSEMQLQSQL